MQRKRTVLASLALSLAVAIAQTGGCMEVSVGGKSAEDIFHDPQTLALVKAACDGDLTKVDGLVKQGANVNATGERDVTPLTWGLVCKSKAGVEELLKLGANPNFKMEKGDSATWLAAGSDDPEWLPLMLAHGGVRISGLVTYQPL